MSNSTKKGQMSVGDMIPLGVTIVVLAIALAIGVIITTDFGEQQCAGYFNESSGGCFTNSTGEVELRTEAYNASRFGSEGIDQLASFVPTIALVIVAAVVIGILITFLIRRLG